MKQLITRWGKTIEKDKVLQEYPRPGLVRDSFLNLNGEWECRIQSGSEEKYQGRILVPFSPESWLSGVQKNVQPGDLLYYSKTFALPEGFRKDRVLLHFGAVDQECEVFLNGKSLGSHKGGYLPFAFDITDALTEGENELTLEVQDWTEERPHARGKQKQTRKGRLSSLFYTPQSGIWKTVWLESVPQSYVEQVQITPLYDAEAVKICVKSGKKERLPVKIRVLDDGVVKETVLGLANQEEIIPMENFKSWSPQRPHLYDVEIVMGEDRVKSYFGMRKFSSGLDKKGILRFYLNNEPFFFNGVLDQGYWPDGLMTAPSDEALCYDIEKLKEMGYNTIRKHIKIEPERFYYHCDRLGMVVWQDMPNGGGEYNMVFSAYLPNVMVFAQRLIKDKNYRLFGRGDAKGRMQYYEDLEGMIRLLYNFPCIAAWVPFNEGWGQFDAKKATERIRKLDPTRLINEACGWFDQGGGDMYSIHNYFWKLKVRPRNRVVALTEYGGFAFPVEGHMACEQEFGYRHYKSLDELTGSYEKLWEEQIFSNLKKGLSAAIYTQTCDIEEEINGIMTYDREVDKLHTAAVRKLNHKLYKMFEKITR